MRKLKILSVALVMAVLASSVFGCYFIKGQTMSKVKGTYKLTHYTYTRSYERREGYTPRTYNYIEDEDCLYEDYLVVTGSGTGYYVHKDVNTPAYSKEVTLSYEYNQEDSSKVEYVIHNDAITINSTSDVNRLGVNGKILNYQKQAIDYTQWFTNKPMRTEALSIRWEKVSDATDLSYAKEQLGTLKSYDYKAFGVRGIYELNTMSYIEGEGYPENPYQYYFCVLDTAQGVTKAKTYYALRETPNEQVVGEVTFANESGDWTKIKVGNDTWNIEPMWQNYYILEKDNVRYEAGKVMNSITDADLQYMVSCRLPMTTE